MSLAAFCPSLVLTIALWRLMTPTLVGFSASAGSARAIPTIGKTNDALFTTDSLQHSNLAAQRLITSAAPQVWQPGRPAWERAAAPLPAPERQKWPTARSCRKAR